MRCSTLPGTLLSPCEHYSDPPWTACRRASAGGKENMEVDDVAEAVTVGATPAPQSLSSAQVQT